MYDDVDLSSPPPGQEDDLKSLDATIADAEKEIDDTKESVATLTDGGIEELDKMVEEATVNRKEGNEDYQSLMASDSAAKGLIGVPRTA